MNKRGLKAVIYTRVSTEMQVDGFSLEGQKRELERLCEYEGTTIVKVYEEKGKSGKSVEGPVCGTLIITKKTNSNGSNSLSDNGAVAGGGKIGYSEPPLYTVAQVNTTQNGRFLLRSTSFGKYLGDGWNPTPTKYSELIDGTYSVSYLTGLALQNAGYTTDTITVKPLLLEDYISYILLVFIRI